MNPCGTVYPSPDEEWLLYRPEPAPQQGATNWSLYHRATGRIHVTELQDFMNGCYESPQSAHVFWNEDSTRLAVSYSYDTPYVGDPYDMYITLTQDGDVINVQEISVSQPIRFDERYFAPYDVAYHDILDLSVDGERVLLVVNEGYCFDETCDLISGSGGTMLVYWKPLTPEESRIIPVDHFPSSASFIDDDDDHILMVDRGNFVRYNIVSGETEILMTNSLLYPGILTVFSPDGQWLAQPFDGGIGLINVRELLES
jgi:hypothetical protein